MRSELRVGDRDIEAFERVLTILENQTEMLRQMIKVMCCPAIVVEQDPRFKPKEK